MLARQTKVPFRREHTGNTQLDRVQAPAQNIIQLIGSVPFLAGGRLISVKLPHATPTTINHGLGSPAAFFVVRENYDGSGNTVDLAESATSAQTGLDLNNQLSIIASDACTVDLWVYPSASQIIPAGTSQSP